MNFLVLLLVLLLAGWAFSLTRSQPGARLLVIASVPAGAILRGLVGYGGARLLFWLSGIPSSQHEWIFFGTAMFFCVIAGSILVPTIALTLIKSKNNPL